MTKEARNPNYRKRLHVFAAGRRPARFLQLYLARRHVAATEAASRFGIGIPHHSVPLPWYVFSVTTKPSVPRKLKGCQTLAGGKAVGRHPRKASANQFDPGGVAEFLDIFVSDTPTGFLLPNGPVVSASLREPATFSHPWREGGIVRCLSTMRGTEFAQPDSAEHKRGGSCSLALRACEKTSAGREANLEQNNPHPDPLPADGRGNSQTSLSQRPKGLDTPTGGGRFSLSHPMGEGRGEGECAPKPEVVFKRVLRARGEKPFARQTVGPVH